MERRLRRYLGPRSSSMPHASRPRPANPLDLHSVAYEATAPAGKTPIFIAQPLRKSGMAQRATNDLDQLAIRAFSYDSAQAGKPPIMGGRPLKGNGPVKLQTRRRVSSGELRVTYQDADRTLDDIRDSGYIVGRKEKRSSQVSQKSNPTSILKRPPSPQSPRAQSGTPGSPLAPSSVTNFSRAQSPALPSPALVRVASPVAGPAMDGHRAPLQGLALGAVSDGHLEAPLSREKRWSQQESRPVRTSLLSHHEEQNATIQALWKAEYSRLVAIYGQDGVDRNIAVLNADPRRSISSEKAGHAARLDLALGPAIHLDPLPTPSFDNASPRLASNSVSSRDHVSPDDASDYASTQRSSFLSTEEASSSYTVRTSVVDTEIPTTREDVRRIVEEMRSTYLNAIEAKAAEQGKSRGQKKKWKKTRASYNNENASERYSPPLKSTGPSRQSWHAANSPTPLLSTSANLPGVQGRPSAAAKAPTHPLPGRQKNEARPEVQRADSMTLGSLMQPLSGNDKSARQPPRSPKKSAFAQPPMAYSHGEHLTPPTPSQHHAQRLSTSSVTASAPNVAPDIDDFDIFYQDLYGPPPAPGMLPSVPPVHSYTLEPAPVHDPAPPPPDIEVSPRRRMVPAMVGGWF